MKNRLIVSVIIWMTAHSPLPASAQGFLKTEGTKIVNEQGENILLRGIGLGGWMLQEGYMMRVENKGMQHLIKARIDSLIGKEKTAAFYEAWLNNHTTRADIEAMKKWGFNSVRLPMHYNLYTLPVDEEPMPDKHTWLSRGFDMTDSLLQWCKDNQLYLILDLHAAPGGQGNDLNISDRDPSKPSLWESDANRKKTIAFWKEIARRYANEPAIAAYDIINEPNWGFEDPQNDKNGLQEKNNAPLKALLVDITQAIREVDNNHIIIIEGNGWGNNYNGILPPWDNNMVLSFHKYWNHNDEASIWHILQMREHYDMPVWLGETGENSNVWFYEAVALFEKHNIGWAWWPLKKIGINNPLELPLNEEYRQLLRYWNGQSAEKPSSASALKGLMQLAADTRFGRTIIHKDVVDALIRQPHTDATTPFLTHLIDGNNTILAADYDLGRNGAAYFDTDTANYRISTGKAGAGNRGHYYRNDGVDIDRDATDGTPFVNHIQPGEWLQFTIEVSKPGNYSIDLQVAVEQAGGKVALELDNVKLSEAVTVSVTGGSNQWSSVNAGSIRLSKGQHRLRILVEQGGFNLRSIHFNKK